MENSLPQITFLFGAGASAQALPTIKGLPARIKYIRDFIDDKYVFEENDILKVRNLEFKKNDAKAYLLEGLEKLHNYSANHSTIDTYAKKLYLNSRHQTLYELSFFLALYFNIEQKLVGIDPRYYTFLISILESHWYKFPENLKFLTWNYDLQMELAHEKISERGSFDLSFGLFNTDHRDRKREAFSSIKINGSCNVKDDFNRLYPMISNIRDDNIDNKDLDWALSYGYTQVRAQNTFYQAHVNIDFAWYKDDKFIKEVSELYKETEILTVIGYSFPFFNREIDRRIIRAMTNLRKIYIQDVSPDNIRSRFLSILPDWKNRGVEIISVDDISEFFLPPEL